MQFGNLGRICSSRHFEMQHQELPGKNNSFLPPVIANICNCTKGPINWITVQLKRNAWDGNPRWCKTVPFTLDVCKQRNITSKNANTTRLWCCGDVADGPAAFVPLIRGTDRLRHPHDWRRCKISPIRFALRWTRMLSLPVQQGTAGEHARTNTHTGWHTRKDACGRGAPQLDGLCRNWFGILHLQCQKVTLRPVPDSASTPSRCAQRGGAPRHKRASGGVAQRLPFNGGQNQAARREGTLVFKSAWALLWLW